MNEDKPKKNYKWIAIGCAVAGIFLIGLFFFFWGSILSTNRALSNPDAVVLVSLVVGVVAIVITALVTLTRQNSEE